MEEFLRFVYFGLALWQLTHLISVDNGPFGVFAWLRYKLGVNVTVVDHGNGETTTFVTYNNQFAEMVGCMYCASFWLGLVLFPLYLYPVYAVDVAIMFLALWGLVTAITHLGD